MKRYFHTVGARALSVGLLLIAAGGVGAQTPAAVAETVKGATSKPGSNATNNVKPSGGLLGPIDAPIDGSGGGGNSATVNPNILVSGSISPTGHAWSLSADVVLPAASWQVSCDTTTSFFNNALGQPVSDDVLSSKPVVTMVAGKATYTCPYKSQAHLLNIAKVVTSYSAISVRATVGGTLYQGNGIASSTCKRATKTTVNFTC